MPSPFYRISQISRHKMLLQSKYWRIWTYVNPGRVMQCGRHFCCTLVSNSLNKPQVKTERRHGQKSRNFSNMTKLCHMTCFSRNSFVIQRQVLVENDDTWFSQPKTTYSTKDWINPKLNIDNKLISKKTQGDVTTTSLTEIAEEVVELLKNEPMFIDLPLSVTLVEECIQVLVDVGHTSVKLKMLIEKLPTLLACDQFPNKVRHLVNYGFTEEHIFNFCKDYPQIFHLPEEQVSHFIERLRDKGFVQESLISLISSKPDILSASPSSVIKRVDELKVWFKSSDVLDLCSKSPHVLVQSFAEIKPKFDYVFHIMGITQRQIMYSRLFDHSLEHIQNRCAFVVRAGLYKKIKKNVGEKNTNPLLQDIIDTKDKDFVKRFGKMSVLDYKAFCVMMHIERSRQDISSDEDYDSEDSE